MKFDGQAVPNSSLAISPVRRPVRKLDPIVANQIAAGEVVERPASVVKELVENALDAGATEITVVVSNGGRTLIEVQDNGWGMSSDDARQALERFGTSKISQTSDLAAIQTLGFRGEALPSIASISHVTVQTQCSDEVGGEITMRGGQLLSEKAGTFQVGTKISVREIFYNVPARKKFLRAEKTEAGVIKTLLQDFALAFPSLRIRYVADGMEILRLAPVADFFARAKELRLGGQRPIEVHYEQGHAPDAVVVQALLSEPIECVAYSNRLRLIVNGRVVRDKLLMKAVRDGYGNYLKGGRYPMGVVRLEVPFSEVDVNVHPQKAEVRFRQPSRIFSALVVGIGRALAKDPMQLAPGQTGEGILESTPREMAPWRRPPLETSHDVVSSLPVANDHLPPLQNDVRWIEQSSGGAVPSPRRESLRCESPSLTSYRFVGQLLHCYLVLERGEEVALVDMHAAHERVMFYRLKSQLLDSRVKTQLLLMPEVLELEGEQHEQFSKARDVLEKLGIEAEEFGENSIVVRAVPALLGATNTRRLLTDILSLPAWSEWSSTVSDRMDNAIARLACHSSIRSGRDLEPREVFALLADLEAADASGYCPHGRPVAKRLSKSDLEQMFGRVL